MANWGKVYVSGPMRGYPDFNYQAFNAATERLRGLGCEVVNPVDIGSRHGTAEEINASPELVEKVLRADLAAVAGCDTIYLLKGWERSDGARRELGVALACDLRVVREGVSFDAAHELELSKNASKKGADFGQLGDCAKLREACANIAEYARSAQCHTEDAHVLGYLNQIEGWAKAALAAPARNCDLPEVAKGQPNLAEQAWRVFKRSHKDSHLDAYGLLRCIRWLLAPATEKEGGVK